MSEEVFWLSWKETLEARLSDAVNKAFHQREVDPVSFVGRHLLSFTQDEQSFQLPKSLPAERGDPSVKKEQAPPHMQTVNQNVLEQAQQIPLPMGDAVREAVQSEYINILFVRHAECMHTALLNDDPRFVYVDPLRKAHATWKACAKDTAFSSLTKPDSPLLPSDLHRRVHEPRLRALFPLLEGFPFVTAAPPLLRTMMTAAITAELAPASLHGLQRCLISSTLLPRPTQPLHKLQDVQALAKAAERALELLGAGLTAGSTADNTAVNLTDSTSAAIAIVLGESIPPAEAAGLLRAVHNACNTYLGFESGGGFVHSDGPTDAPGAPDATPQVRFARWAFQACQDAGCRNLVIFGGCGWFDNVIKQFGENSLDAVQVDALHPPFTLKPGIVDADGKPQQKSMLPHPAGSRFVRLVHGAGSANYSLELPTPASATAQKDMFAAAAATSNLTPPHATDGPTREIWLRRLLASGELYPF